MRYGRQYFREISGDGFHFGFPAGGEATLAFSRILDTDEVLVAMNLTPVMREDWITVDYHLSPPGRQMVDMLNGGGPVEIEERNGRASVRLTLSGHQMMVLKLVQQ